MPQSDAALSQVALPDGRVLDVVTAGPPDGLALLFHLGTPSGAVPWPVLTEAAAARGLRQVSWSRPGYGASTPQPGRQVASVAADASAVLDHLGHDRFVTAGWSGGGRHALASAALLPGRCLAAATLAGVAPSDGAGLDWLAGMGEENLEEFALAGQGGEQFERFLAETALALATVTPSDVGASLGDLVGQADREAATGAFAEFLVAMLAAAVSEGVAGWRDDDVAFLQPWGFDLGAIEAPVTVWQGDQDRMVPDGHGRWLAAHVPTARLVMRPEEGHLSLVTHALGDILDDLVQAAG